MKPKGKAGIILTVVTAFGMIVTVVLTAKKAPEAQKAKEDALARKREETGDENAQLTRMESIKVQAGCYLPVVCTAAATTASLVASQVLPQTAIADLEKWKHTYKEVAAKVNGAEAEQMMEQMTTQKITQGTDGLKKETFVIEFDDEDILFETTLLDVMEAEYNANRYFKGTGELCFNDLLYFLHLDKRERGDEFGWQEYIGEAFYGYCWIDFQHRRTMRDGKPVTYIDMPFGCHPLNEVDCEEEINSTIIDHGIA